MTLDPVLNFKHQDEPHPGGCIEQDYNALMPTALRIWSKGSAAGLVKKGWPKTVLHTPTIFSKKPAVRASVFFVKTT